MILEYEEGSLWNSFEVMVFQFLNLMSVLNLKGGG